MTHYEKQLAYNRKYADRIRLIIQTPTLIMFESNNEWIHIFEYDETGTCTSAYWRRSE
jgi:hypothetical protein